VEEGPQQFLVVPDSLQLADHRLVQVMGVPRRKVTQTAVLQPPPQELDRHQFRGVRRQRLDVQAPFGLWHPTPLTVFHDHT
jgi:hypothetical protein